MQTEDYRAAVAKAEAATRGLEERALELRPRIAAVWAELAAEIERLQRIIRASASAAEGQPGGTADFVRRCR